MKQPETTHGPQPQKRGRRYNHQEEEREKIQPTTVEDRRKNEQWLWKEYKLQWTYPEVTLDTENFTGKWLWHEWILTGEYYGQQGYMKQ